MGRKVYIDDIDNFAAVEQIAWEDQEGNEERISRNGDGMTFRNSLGSEVGYYCKDIPKIIKALELAVKEGWNE